MKKIKFRAWLNVENKMIQPKDFYGIDYYNGCIWYKKNDESRGVNFTGVEIMQSTGLKDKNGVEVFEGDIIITKEEVRDLINYEFYEKEVANTVIYDSSRAMFTLYQEGWGIVDENMSELEVVGNIFENKELLNA